jgi:hypothetical protein
MRLRIQKSAECCGDCIKKAFTLLGMSELSDENITRLPEGPGYAIDVELEGELTEQRRVLLQKLFKACPIAVIEILSNDGGVELIQDVHNEHRSGTPCDRWGKMPL